MSKLNGLKTKAMSLFLSLVLIIAIMPVDVLATEISSNEITTVASGECGENGDNVVWKLDSNDTLTISGNGAMADYSWTNFVPNTPWYGYRQSIKRIVVEDGVTAIGSSAFYKLSYATDVDITNDVLSFKKFAFAGCSRLQAIDFPDNLKYIANDCFEDCSSLSSVVIPESVEKFEYSIFDSCTGLTEVKLPSSMKELPRSMFYGCTSLESITIPEGITEISPYFLGACTSLKNINFPKSLKIISYSAFADCTGLEEINIPNTVEEIYPNTFNNCTRLVKVNLPCNLQTISKSVFYNCTKLKSIEIPVSVKVIEDEAFYNCSSLNNVVIKEGLEQIGESAFYKCINLSNIVLPESITYMGKNSYGFYNNIYDETAVIPGAKIYCYKDSTVENYAKNSGVAYSTIDINIDEAEYTGNPVTPNIYIRIDEKLLEKDSDFTVEYENNIDVGVATATIKFINEYSAIGMIKRNYCIGNNINNYDISLDKDVYQYHMRTPNVSIKANDYTLVCGKDYEVYYSLAGETWKKSSENTSRSLWDLGKCTIRIVGINKYIGEKIIPITVEKFDMSNATLWTNWVSNSSHTYEMKNFQYDGRAKTQSGFRVCDDDNTISSENYDITYKNNVEPGTATMIITGKGDYYTGTLEKKFEIYPRAISSIKVTKNPDKIVYSTSDEEVDVTGGQITIYYKDGGQEVLDMTSDMLDGNYNLSVAGAQNIGLRYKNYPAYFEVTVIKDLLAPQKVTAQLYGYDDVKVSWESVEGADAYEVYYKKSTASTYTYLGRKTTDLSYKKANLTDGAKYYFKIVPCSYVNGEYYADESYKTASIYTLKKVSTPTVVKYGTKVKVSWKNISGESGYQISKSTRSTGTNIVSTYNTTSGTSRTISATKGKTYYYKVRAFRLVDGKKIYAPWSTAVKFIRK